MNSLKEVDDSQKSEINSLNKSIKSFKSKIKNLDQINDNIITIEGLSEAISKYYSDESEKKLLKKINDTESKCNSQLKQLKEDYKGVWIYEQPVSCGVFCGRQLPNNNYKEQYDKYIKDTKKRDEYNHKLNEIKNNRNNQIRKLEYRLKNLEKINFIKNILQGILDSFE